MAKDLMATENPYQTPAAVGPPPIRAALGDCFREDKFLIVRERSEVPGFCVKNGEEVAAGGWRKNKAIAWTPPWVYLGLLGGLVPLVILMLVGQKKAKVTYSLGSEARKALNTKRWVGVGFLLLCAGLIIGTANSSSSDAAGMMGLGAFLSFIFSLVAFIAATPLRPVAHRNGWFKVKGVSPELLDRLPAVDFRSL